MVVSIYYRVIELQTRIDLEKVASRQREHHSHRLSGENWNPERLDELISIRNWIPASTGKTRIGYAHRFLF